MTASGLASAAATSSVAAPVYALRVRELVRESPDAMTLVFDPAQEHADHFAYAAGQYLELEIPWEGFAIRRCYSLSSAPGIDDFLAVTVKRVKGGRMSNRLLDTLQIGDVINCLAPAGDFVAKIERDSGGALAQRSDPLIAFAGGSGITPVFSLIKTALHQSGRKVALVYANRDEASTIFASQLAELAAAFPERLQVHHHRDDAAGLMTETLLLDALARLPALAGAELFLCGPTPFMQLVEGTLDGAGIAPGQLRIERFISRVDPDRQAATPALQSKLKLAPQTVSITLKGKRHHVGYTPGETLLETCKRHGIDAPRSCEDGYCGSCMAVLKYGQPDLGRPQALSAADIERGRVLTCQLRPATAEPFAVTYDEAEFRRSASGGLGTDAPAISKWRALAVAALLALAVVGLRFLRAGL